MSVRAWGEGVGWGQKAHPCSWALKLRAAITPYCKLSPRICWGESWRKRYVARWFSASQTSHQESNAEPCNTDLQALGASSSGEHEVAEKSKLGICLLHEKHSRWTTSSRKPRTGRVRKKTKTTHAYWRNEQGNSGWIKIKTHQGLRDASPPPFFF